MITIIVFALIVVPGLVWIKSGRDQLYWLIRALHVFRAALRMLPPAIALAARYWWTEMPQAIQKSTQEVQG